MSAYINRARWISFKQVVLSIYAIVEYRHLHYTITSFLSLVVPVLNGDTLFILSGSPLKPFVVADKPENLTAVEAAEMGNNSISKKVVQKMKRVRTQLASCA